nr:hypothetical protein [bacterium]
MRKHGNSQTTFSGSGIGNAAVITCAIIILWSILQVTQGFGIFTDDPFISFRYARNIANGHGAVFNTGHRVEGYSNFLWVLILAGIIRLGGDPVVASKWIGCLCNLATLTLIILYSRRLLSRTWTLWI